MTATAEGVLLNSPTKKGTETAHGATNVPRHTSVCQLPQVTGNEMSPAIVAALAARFSNFYLFKDTGGNDRVAESGLELDGVFLVRGAEGDYARWPRSFRSGLRTDEVQ